MKSLIDSSWLYDTSPGTCLAIQSQQIQFNNIVIKRTNPGQFPSRNAAGPPDEKLFGFTRQLEIDIRDEIIRLYRIYLANPKGRRGGGGLRSMRTV